MNRVQDWSVAGGLEKSVRGESQASYETPGRLLDKADAMGRQQGEVRSDPDAALGDDNGAHRFIAGAVGVRKAVRKQTVLKQAAPLHSQAESAEDRASGEIARSSRIREQLEELRKETLPGAFDRLREARENVALAKAELLSKPRHRRGYFSSPWPVGLAAGSVVVFDSFVLHGALTTSGLDAVSVWGTTATVAMAIAAANHAFGVLAGAIGLAVPARRRLHVAGLLFVAGFGAILTSFLLLMFFRADAIHAANDALTEIAKGKIPDHLSLFVSPLWMGPLQVGGSLAAITLTAFWTMAEEGREYTRLAIVPAEVIQTRASGEIEEARGRIKAAETALEEAIVTEHELRAAGKAAAADHATALQVLEAAETGEDSLKEAAEGRYRNSYTHHDNLYGNAGLWRMATSSFRGWFTRRWRNRGAADKGSDEATVAARRAHRAAGARRPAPSRVDPELIDVHNGNGTTERQGEV